ncbi:MAG: hypothetical protein EBS55_13365 [Flavobacteriaceae bacterium]|nr:hypothetical protein [Flavobacteriaceae bacterium]
MLQISVSEKMEKIDDQTLSLIAGYLNTTDKINMKLVCKDLERCLVVKDEEKMIEQVSRLICGIKECKLFEQYQILVENDEAIRIYESGGFVWLLFSDKSKIPTTKATMSMSIGRAMFPKKVKETNRSKILQKVARAIESKEVSLQKCDYLNITY